MKNLQQFIRDAINGNTNIRCDCFACSGKNTLSISKIDGNIVYYCFRASCGIRGKLNDELSIDDLRNIPNSLSNRATSISNSIGMEYKQRQTDIWIPPEYFTSPLQNKLCLNVLNRYNLIDFYSKNTDLIRYDPKQDRLVFILKDHKGVLKGAVGRSLSFNITPRWYVYERIAACPFISVGDVQAETPCILVEDCISACVLQYHITSIGLLGTNIPDECITYLLPYSRLYIALDDDATAKSIKLQKRLSIYRPTEIIPIKKDIKYYSSQELENLIRSL